MSQPPARNPVVKQIWLLDTAQSATDECVLWPWGCNSYGYGQVQVKGRKHLVNHLVLQFALRPRPVAPRNHALHASGCDRRCANPRHLRWGSNNENVEDRLAWGRSTGNSGSRNGRSKFTESEVIQLRLLHGAGETQQALADHYGVSQSTISLIVRQKTWRSTIVTTTL